VRKVNFGIVGIPIFFEVKHLKAPYKSDRDFSASVGKSPQVSENSEKAEQPALV
jgi:hypothetical protein